MRKGLPLARATGEGSVEKNCEKVGGIRLMAHRCRQSVELSVLFFWTFSNAHLSPSCFYIFAFPRRFCGSALPRRFTWLASENAAFIGHSAFSRCFRVSSEIQRFQTENRCIARKRRGVRVVSSESVGLPVEVLLGWCITRNHGQPGNNRLARP